MRTATNGAATLLLVAFLALLLWSIPQLPEQVVSHMNAQGPDGWMPRKWFVALFAGTVLGFEALFRWGIPAMMRRTPKALVNIPHKSYWMSTPDRQRVAYHRVLGLIGPSRLFLHLVMLIALYACLQATGLPLPVHLPLGWLGFIIGGGSLVFTVGVFAWALIAFRPPKDLPSA